MQDNTNASVPVNEGLSNAVNEVIVDSITGKKWYLSKTFWANVILGVAIIAQSKYGFIVGPELQALAIAGINVGLRKITNEPVVW